MKSISDRPIRAFALILLLTAAAIWGERELVRLGATQGFDAAAFFVFFLGWAGIALLTVALYRRLRADARRRIAAEEVADQASRLMQITAALGGTRTSIAAIETILQEPVHALHADSAMVLLLADNRESATVARAIGYRELPETVALQHHSILANAINQGILITLDSRQARRAEYPNAPADDWLGGEALAAVPLSLERRVAGLLILEFHAPRGFHANDRELLETVGARGSQALERTRQYESSQRARIEAESLRARADEELAERQRTESALRASETQYRALAARTARLHELTAALSEAVKIDAVARAVVEHGQIVVGASEGELLLLTEDGSHFQRLSSESGVAEPIKAEPGLSLTDAVQSRQPVFIRSFAEWQEKSWRSAPMAADRGFASSAALPLLVESKPIGVLVFEFSAPVNFEESYRTVLISVAQHCAQALDRARLYESAEQARTDAEAANRHKDEFLSMVSHELRTPLNAILGWASMLQEGVLEPAVTDRAVRSIHTNAMRQSKLIEELLDVTRIVSGRTKLDSEQIDLSRLLGGVVESVIPLAASNGVELRLDPVPPVILDGDVRRLEQVFLNLLSNALKFTPEGGSITLAARQDGDALEVSVTDTGIGIDLGFLPYVFDRFRQADSTTTRASGGLGLGLTIAKHIVESHKGTIAVQSAGAGQGTTFTVRLPGQKPERRSEPGAAGAGVGRRATDSAALDGVRVLVVDDDSDAREVIARALEARGARVTMAESASDGFASVLRGNVDILLADIAMPIEDGYSLMRRIRGHADGRIASIPAIAVTAGAGVKEQREALAAGFHMHLAKPVEPVDLARHVQQLITLSERQGANDNEWRDGQRASR
jgi:signal transduction histidine kinase/ActR/RegA family two-component response regulator